MANNVPKTFEIIIQHFSGETLCQSQEEIYDSVEALDQDEGSDPVTLDDVRRTLRYLKNFGLAEKPRRSCCWHIKSVEKMCNWLCDLDDNPYIGVGKLNHPISLAFGIIIHHFNDQTVPTTEIETRIETEIENYQGELSQYKNENIVPHTLRFLNHFGFAKELEDGDWRIKSVDDMCDWLRALVDNHNIGDEGEDF